jgi:hypothetical protein
VALLEESVSVGAAAPVMAAGVWVAVTVPEPVVTVLD